LFPQFQKFARTHSQSDFHRPKSRNSLDSETLSVSELPKEFSKIEETFFFQTEFHFSENIP
jgi:hypothetical protein